MSKLFKLKKGRDAGFTFIEVMILAGVLMFVFVGTGQTLDYLVKSGRHQNLLWDAGQVGETVVLELLNMYGSSPDLIDGNHTRYYDVNKIVSLAPSFYKVDWTIRDNQPILSVKEITLTVTWKEGDLDRTTGFTTYR